MLRTPVLLLVLPILPLYAAAQGSPAAPHTQTLYVLPPALNCPVDLHARVHGTPSIDTARGNQPAKPALRLHLVLAEGQAKHIAAARVMVRGLTGKLHTFPAQADSQASLDRMRTFDVAFAPENATDLAGDLELPGYTSVISLQIVEVRYADGHTVRMDGQESCRFTPDLLVLVGRR